MDHGGSGSEIVSFEAPRNFGCIRYQCFGASDIQVGHFDHGRPGRKGESKIPFVCFENISACSRFFGFQHVGSTGGVCPEFNIWGGVGWGGVGMIPFLAIAHISVLRN